MVSLLFGVLLPPGHGAETAFCTIYATSRHVAGVEVAGMLFIPNPPDTSKSLLPSLTRPAAASGGASTAAADLTTSVLHDRGRMTGFWGKDGSIVTCLPMDRYSAVMVPKTLGMR